MSELTPPEPGSPVLPGRDRGIVGTAIASVMLHLGVLVLLLWQPLPNRAEAAPPPAIDVELVRPTEAVSASEPRVEPPEEHASAEPPPPTETSKKQTPPPKQAASPIPSPAEAPAPEKPSGTVAPEAAPGGATATSEPARGLETSATMTPIPLSRPSVRGLTATASVPDKSASTITADTGEIADVTAPPAQSAEPDVATLELGPPRIADHFFLKAMLSAPSMARARAMIETLPPERRLAQTCNLEALAQIGNAGKGFTPDVVMAEAYARSKMAGTHLAAGGAIFRSGEKWYGLAFDCTLSKDLSTVTAFSYRLGVDVTDAVLARLSQTGNAGLRPATAR